MSDSDVLLFLGLYFVGGIVLVALELELHRIRRRK